MNEERIREIEKRVDNLELRTTINERDIQSINLKLDKIESNTAKIIWLIVGTVLAGVLKFALNM